MTIQTFVSVVRTLLASLVFWLFVASCTVRHFSELTRQTTADLGLRTSVSVSRSADWALPDHTVVYLAEPALPRDLQASYPRLHLELTKALKAEVQERFPRHVVAQTGQTLTDSLAVAVANRCNILLQISIRQVDEQLSSASEWRDDHGFVDTGLGSDRLRLVLKIFDVNSGRLLDTLSVDSRSGWWRWREHQVAELIEPALSAIFEQLRVRQVAYR